MLSEYTSMFTCPFLCIALTFLVVLVVLFLFFLLLFSDVVIDVAWIHINIFDKRGLDIENEQRAVIVGLKLAKVTITMKIIFCMCG